MAKAKRSLLLEPISVTAKRRAGWSSGHLMALGVPAICLFILSTILLRQLDVLAPAWPMPCPKTFETTNAAAAFPRSTGDTVILDAWLHLTLRVSATRAEIERRPTWFDRLIVCPILAFFGLMLVFTGALAAREPGAPVVERVLSAVAALAGCAYIPLALLLASYSQVLRVEAEPRSLQVRTTLFGVRTIEHEYPAPHFALHVAGAHSSAYAVLDGQARQCVWMGRLSKSDQWVPARLEHLLHR